jgi:carbamoyl-phosphate synthase large subunit
VYVWVADACDYLRAGHVDLLINIPESNDSVELTDGYQMRRCAVDFDVALLTNIKCATLFVSSLACVKKLHVKSWDEYLTDSKIAL